jgi:non-ribosomal peptide synthetase component F
MLVIRTEFDRQKSFRQILRQVKETALSAYDHKDVPFEKIIEDLHPARILSQTPLFQVTFQLQNAARESAALSGLKLTPLANEFEAAKFDLTLLMIEKENPDSLIGLFRYNKDLFDEATIRRMQMHFEVLLQSIVAHPDDPLFTLKLSSADERSQLVATFNEQLN